MKSSKNKKIKQELLHRHSANPIITIKDIPYRSNAVFNAGATLFGDKTLLLMRVEDRRGISHLTVAHSKNGLSEWKIADRPTFVPEPIQYPEEVWGIEDPRITFLEDLGKWAIVYTAYSENGPLVSIARTDDFKIFERLGAVMLPTNKDAALFPIQFGGRWAMIHRPVPFSYPSIRADVWISFSPDLKHWGDHQILFKARSGAWWDAQKIGLASPPLKTSEGWLVLYHGAKQTVSGEIYRLGLALLDLNDPTKVIRRSDEWIFSPQEDYERVGDVFNVAFPCGVIQKGEKINLYYGAADSSIAVATGDINQMLLWLKEQG